MSAVNESLLNAWLRLSTSVVNTRWVSEMSYNESLICNILYQHLRQNPEQKITATDLCRETKMLKSQMNRTLNLLESRNIIRKERSSEDKRQVWISLDWDQAELYKSQHERILKLVDTVIEKIGEEDAIAAVEIITKLSDVADDVCKDLQKGLL